MASFFDIVKARIYALTTVNNNKTEVKKDDR